MACDEPCECPKLGIDYYGVLGLEKNAHESDIHRALVVVEDSRRRSEPRGGKMEH